MQPLQQWICDECHGVIDGPSVGNVVWISKSGTPKAPELRYSNFRIVHMGSCDDSKKYSGSLSITDFLGVDGLNTLLGMLDVGQVKRRLGQTGEPTVRDMGSYVDLFRRVQVPRYEEARQYFGNEEVLDLHSDGNEFSPYTETALAEIIQIATSQGS